MDELAYEALSERLNFLEVQLSSSDFKENDTILKQITTLKHQLGNYCNEHNEFETLNRIMKDLDLWERKDEIPDSAGPLEESPVDDDVTTLEMKEQILLSKYPIIRQAMNDLTELSNMDVQSIVNYTSSAQDTTHDFVEDRQSIMLKAPELEQLTDQFHLLVVKNLLVLEKYASLAFRENQFWTSVNDRMKTLNQRINRLEQNSLLSNKY
ncbi:uncharacterized protein PRCAT00004045001 [Priceomyces carsonii]|uniref:uncharacterized protein n=1 Tax=Priceomyces carsonii TaxID=28549 RepID=UPI002ED7B52B|nr:unnamed protein product [Priceomyces carsonii]